MGILLHIAQNISLRLEQILGPVVRKLMLWRGVRRITTYPQSNNKNNVDDLIFLASRISKATKIQMAFGELDSSIMEQPILLNALQKAIENDAQVEIIHGPCTDPRTESIFRLGKKGLFKMYMTEKYIPHHFMLLTNNDGTTTVLDENTHNETIWNEDGQTDYVSKFRVSYVIEQSHRLAQKLEQEYISRKAIASPTFSRISDRPKFASQKPVDRKILLRGLENLPLVYILQPISVLVDFSFMPPYHVQSDDSFIHSANIMKEKEPDRIAEPRLEIIRDGEKYEETIYIDTVTAEVTPKVTQFKCVCCEDGIVRYERGPLETWNGTRHIIIKSIQAYRCDHCEFSAHLNEIEDELHTLVVKAENASVHE